MLRIRPIQSSKKMHGAFFELYLGTVVLRGVASCTFLLIAVMLNSMHLPFHRKSLITVWCLQEKLTIFAVPLTV